MPKIIASPTNSPTFNINFGGFNFEGSVNQSEMTAFAEQVTVLVKDDLVEASLQA